MGALCAAGPGHQGPQGNQVLDQDVGIHTTPPISTNNGGGTSGLSIPTCPDHKVSSKRVLSPHPRYVPISSPPISTPNSAVPFGEMEEEITSILVEEVEIAMVCVDEDEVLELETHAIGETVEVGMVDGERDKSDVLESQRLRLFLPPVPETPLPPPYSERDSMEITPPTNEIIGDI